MNEEEEQWQLMHILGGDHTNPGRCDHQCHDPTCRTGCLRMKAAIYFRGDIMHGVEILRKHSDPRFPLMVPCPKIKAEDCLEKTSCLDPVCQIVGCMGRPAYNFRELIKIAQDDKLIKALKK